MTNIIHIELDQIQLSPYRHDFAVPSPASDLLALAEKRGFEMLPHMRVRRLNDDRYELVSGIQVYLIANQLQKFEHPVECLALDDAAAQEMVRLDYQQTQARPTLPPMALGRLLKQAAQSTGVSYAHIGKDYGLTPKQASVYVRLTRLCEPVQALVDAGKLSVGIARLLVTLPPLEQSRLAHKVIDKGLTVRRAEQAVRDVRTGHITSENSISLFLAKEVKTLSEAVGSEVKLEYDPVTHKGRIVIAFSNIDIYEGIAERLTGVKRDADG